MAEETPAIPPVAPAPWATPQAPVPPVIDGAGAALAANPEAPVADATPAAVMAPADPEAPQTPEAPVTDASETDPTEFITVTVPKAFNLRISLDEEIKVSAGVQSMSRERAEHWYSKANGVKIFNPNQPEA